MAKIGIFDAVTNTQIERDMTEEELTQLKKDVVEYETMLSDLINAKTTAEAKLAALGLTSDDLKALGLGGTL